MAIHGLNGHAFNTWEYRNRRGDSFMWLRDGLQERIRGARTLIYGYHADVDSTVQTGRIKTFSDTFLERLRQLREDTRVSAPFQALQRSMTNVIILDSESPSSPHWIFNGRNHHQTGRWDVFITNIFYQRSVWDDSRPFSSLKIGQMIYISLF